MSTIFKKGEVWYVAWYEPQPGAGKSRRRYKSLQTKSERKAKEKQKEHDEQMRRPRTSYCDTTVAELCEKYRIAMKKRHVDRPGPVSSRYGVVLAALKTLEEGYGNLYIDDFTVECLMKLQRKWIEDGRARATVNDYVSIVRQMFHWALAETDLPFENYVRLGLVKQLKKGQTDAKDRQRSKVVAQEHIDAIRDDVPEMAGALIELQMLTAARPGELLSLKPTDIDTRGDVWIATLREHKTAYCGEERKLRFGPKAQAILRKWMAKVAVDTVIFRYDMAGYRWAIRRAIERYNKKADEEDRPRMPHWSPNQLRHTAATRIRKNESLDAVQVILGHKQVDMTQHYAKADEEKANAVILAMG